MAGKRKSFDADKAWANASARAKEEGTTLTAEIAKRNAGDKAAQERINKYYGKKGGGDMSMTAEGQAHLREASKTARLKGAANRTGNAVNEVRLEAQDAIAGLDEYKKQSKKKSKKSYWAGD